VSYLFFASMDIDPAHEALFNEVYDSEHVPLLSGVKGVTSIRRYESIPFDLSLGGEVHRMNPNGARYVACYELTSPKVLTSEAWTEAVEQGRWPTEVRPYTSNRSHRLLGPL
jgi:hypothetical protein